MRTNTRFLFELARELHMPVGEMQERMSHEELITWLALYRLEGIEREHAEKMKK